MNIYKVYLDNLTEMLSQFKSDNNIEFDENELLRKLTLEPPKNLDHGDISTNISMLLSKYLKLKPIDVANKLLLNFQMCAKDVALYRPLELNYDKLRVSFTKGCFRGQEIIARMHYLGVNRRTFCTIINDTDHQL